MFYEHLNPGGRVIIDLILPERMEIGTISTSTFTFSSGDVITVEDKLVEFNMIHQYSVSYLKYEKWREGALIQSELQRFALRWYGNEEFKLVLESIGFSDIVCSTDYVYGKQPTDGSQIFTLKLFEVKFLIHQVLALYAKTFLAFGSDIWR